MHRFMFVTLLFTVGCNSAVKRDFQATWDEVQAPPPALESRWLPDMSVRVSDRLIEAALAAALEGADLSSAVDLPGLKLTPALRVDQLDLVPARTPCSGCLGVQGVLRGDLGYKMMGLAGRTGLSMKLGFDTGLQVSQEGSEWVVLASPPKVWMVDTEIPSTASRIAESMVAPLISWASVEISEHLAPIRLARLGELDLPLQAARVSTTEGVVEIELRSRAAVRAAVDPAPPPGDGWSARVALPALLSVARKAAFDAGSVGLNVWAEPRDLDLDDGTFSLDLRLWRVAGFGWWRDYRIEGDLTTSQGQVSLTARDVRELGQSPGAGFVDPLAAMLEAKILSTLAGAVNASIPSSRTADIGSTRTTWEVTRMTREGDDLLIFGRSQFETAR